MNRVGEGGRQSIVRVHFLLVVVYNLWKPWHVFIITFLLAFMAKQIWNTRGSISFLSRATTFLPESCNRISIW